MDLQREVYVTFIYPRFHSGLWSNRPSDWIKSPVRMVSRDVATVSVPKSAVGFRFFDILTTKAEVDGGTIELRSGRIHQSGTYYVDAEVFDLGALKKQDPHHPVVRAALVRDLDDVPWVVRTRCGDLEFFGPKDVCLPAGTTFRDLLAAQKIAKASSV